MPLVVAKSLKEMKKNKRTNNQKIAAARFRSKLVEAAV
jgi:hypothetical protein